MNAGSGRSGAGGRALKVALVVALALGAMMLAGCEEEEDGPGRGRANFKEDGEYVYFDFKDPPYDDKGPGTYTYPLIAENHTRRAILARTQGGGIVGNPVEDNGTSSFSLDAKQGFFDITDFRVVDGGSDVIFEITTSRPIPQFRDDGTSEAKGWFLQLMDIYIDRGHKPGTGHTRTLPGRNVGFAPEDAWDKMIYVNPQVSWDVRRLIEQITWDMDFVRLKKDIIIPDTVLVQGYTFSVYVPKGLIGTPKPNWGYQCMMMLFDPSNLEVGHFQEGKVQRFAGNNVFGGADEYGGHPNVIDILSPTPESQYEALSNYVSDPNSGGNRYAVVPMMRVSSSPARKVVARGKGKARTVARAPAARVRPASLEPVEARAPSPAATEDEDDTSLPARAAAARYGEAQPLPVRAAAPVRRPATYASSEVEGEDDAPPPPRRRIPAAAADAPDVGSDATPPASDGDMFSNTQGPAAAPAPARRPRPRRIKVDRYDDAGDGD